MNLYSKFKKLDSNKPIDQLDYDRPKKNSIFNAGRTENQLKIRLTLGISDFLIRLCEGQSKTKNVKLQQAIGLIRKLLSSNPKFHLDLHGNNFMFRRTKYGVQLVITDPIAFVP